MDRRTFLAALAAPLAASCEFADGRPRPATGRLLGPDMALGHRLLVDPAPAPTETLRVPVVIIGGGIGGLSAAWQLARDDVSDFRLFEMEAESGGNARSGENEVSAFPWGAHYLPLPTREGRSIRELLSDLGVLSGSIDAEMPVYEERHLVHVPQERLYISGLWQEGLLPRIGVAQRDFEQYRRFEDMVQRYKAARDRTGRKPFALPIRMSGIDAAAHALDATSMRDWLLAQGFDSPFLHWYADYACRDDYGTRAADTSAWAGLHYYACRDGQAANADSHSVLTWPEGNGWIVKRLSEWLQAHGAAPVQTRALCTRLSTTRTGAELDIFLAAEQRSIRVRAEQVLWAAPAFVLARVWENPPPGLREAAARVDYVPWLVANLTLDARPDDLGPAGLAWDNVLYESNALGYVVATHQAIRVKPGATVITWYRPLTDGSPREARMRLANTDWKTWVDEIVAELARPHPALPGLLKRIDIWRWAHAMPRPVPGFLRRPLSALLAGLDRPLAFAHSDLGGLSLFEEAHDAGVRAAQRVRRMRR
ncbi:MAG: NAD(P)-binding protein [Betaproteobacteria bacterium]|nr:NAD(P)-binding protein [Betaproteobacteria bacterium]